VSGQTDPDPIRIAPVAYSPPSGQARSSARKISPMYGVYALLGLLLLVAIGLFVISKAVRLDIVPSPDSVKLSGGFGIAVGDGHLLLPGQYQLKASKQGYQDLSETFEVGQDKEQRFRYELTRLPGKLTVISEPAGADLFVDDNGRGTTPLIDLELAPGKHQLLLRAPRFQAYEAEIEIEGGGIVQTFKATLKPGWAPVSISSRPAGADILIDGEVAGKTPGTLEVGGGAHEVQLQLEGYRSWRDNITVRPGEALKLPTVQLAKANGNLQLTSAPSGAAISVDGNYRGQTPLGLTLAPGKEYEISLSAPGHRPATRRAKVASGLAEDLHVRLDPILGSVRLEIEPADARVTVDGKVLAGGTRQLQLTTTEHTFEISKKGFVTQTLKLTPRQTLEQKLEVRLKGSGAQAIADLPRSVRSKSGLKMVLIKPGAFTMGSQRGTQGRQSNEPQRKIRLTKAFYLSSTEITNAQFRQFRSKHSSGISGRQTLDNERQPVVRVSWKDAALFCNWLSEQDNLAPAYDESNNMKLVSANAPGYRLPTEAEWEWAARFAHGANLRYPWGNAMPPSAKSGNFADRSAEGTVGATLSDYDDGFVAASPVASFAPNPLGVFDMGGNVAEWTHDWYTGLPSLGGAEETDPMGPDSGRGHVVRGSSWAHGGLIQLRLAYRDFHQGSREDLGFRVARYAQ
tara:strand:- start:5513 stop:7567 length:2055 start_codon:yes stop_codon:yes gene_type:complete